MNKFCYEIIEEDQLCQTVQLTKANEHDNFQASNMPDFGATSLHEVNKILSQTECVTTVPCFQSEEVSCKQETPSGHPSNSRLKVAYNEQGPVLSTHDRIQYPSVLDNATEIEVYIRALIELNHIRESRSSKNEFASCAVILMAEIMSSPGLQKEISSIVNSIANDGIIDGMVKFTIEQMLIGNSKVIAESSSLLQTLSSFSTGFRSVLYNLTKFEIFEWMQSCLQRVQVSVKRVSEGNEQAPKDHMLGDHFAWVVCFVVDSGGPALFSSDQICESISKCIVSLLKGELSNNNTIRLCNAWSKILSFYLPKNLTFEVMFVTFEVMFVSDGLRLHEYPQDAQTLLQKRQRCQVDTKIQVSIRAIVHV